VFRVHVEQSSKDGDRLIKLLLFSRESPFVEQGILVKRLEFESGIEALKGLFNTVEIVESDPSVDKNLRIGRIELKGLLIAGEGLIVPVKIVQESFLFAAMHHR